jgi:septum formation topological specificity factor MinE
MDKDKLNLAKSKAHSNNPDVLGHMRNNIVKNIWQLVDSTTVNGKLEEKLRGSGLLTEDAFNEMVSARVKRY